MYIRLTDIYKIETYLKFLNLMKGFCTICVTHQDVSKDNGAFVCPIFVRYEFLLHVVTI